MKRLVYIAVIVLLMLTSCTESDQKTSQQESGFGSIESRQEEVKPETQMKINQPVPLIDCTNLNLLEKVYLNPLGLTTVIGVPWSSPAELDPDSVITTYEIKMIGNPVLREKYLVNQQYLYPAEDVENYTADYFGMTAEETRKSSNYDNGKKAYVVEMGLGGAWGAYAVNAQQEEDILHLEYCIVNSYNQTTAYGVLDIRLWADGSYLYLANRQEDMQIPDPGDGSFVYPDPITETADGTVVLNLGGNNQTRMTYTADFMAKADQLLEFEVTGNWQGGAVNLFLYSPDKQLTPIRITKNYSDTVLLSGGEWNYNCTGTWQNGNASIIARLKDRVVSK